MTEILALRQQNEYASQAMDEFSHAKEQLREYEEQYQGVSAALQVSRGVCILMQPCLKPSASQGRSA